MRLPQSSIQSLFRNVNFATFSVAVLLLGMVAASAYASPLPLASAPSNLRFGRVVVGQTQTLLGTVTNSGQESVTISSISVSNPVFIASGLTLPLVLLPGQSVDVSVTFAPTSVGWVGGNIKFFGSGPSSAMVFQFEGTGVSSNLQVSASPAIVSFGQVTIGSSSTVPVVLTNGHGWATTFSSFQMTGDAFSMSTPTLPFTLAAGQSATVNVTFTPQSAGLTGGGLFVASSGLTIPLSGTGIVAAPGQLSVAPAPLNFGNVMVGNTSTQTVTLSATGASVTVSSAASSSPQFALKGASLPITIPAGGSTSLNVTFSPQASGASSGALSIVSNASNSQATESLGGMGMAAPGQLSIAPAPLNFGNVTVGNTVTQAITLGATGADVTISSAASNSPQFVLKGVSFPLTIPAGGSTLFNVTFSPQASGASSGALSIVSNASNSQATESLAGTGMAPAPGQLSIAPAPLNFGDVTVGNSGTAAITLSAIGASVTVSSAASSSSQFVLNGASFPLTIAAGGSTSFNVTFTPQSGATASGTLSFVSNASNSQATESLTGTGTLPSYTVNLSWNSASGVAGYNIYRSTAANGTYSKLNPTTNQDTAYTDGSVTSGQTYYYAATSVSATGQESARSTPVQAAVP